MQDSNLFTRDDTFFGVCEGLGEDLGINANLLRITFALLLFWNPVATLAGYLTAGILVLASRWLYPAPVEETCQTESADQMAAEEQERLPLAA